MAFDKSKYVIRGIPLIPTSENAAEIYGAFNFKNVGRPSFTTENPHLGKVLDHRAGNVERNMNKEMWKHNFDDIVLLGERNFRVCAGVVFEGLYLASEDGAVLSIESGLPILTKKMGNDMIALYRGTHMAAENSDEFLEFLRDKSLPLFDLISIMSSDYRGSPPVFGKAFEPGDPTSSAEFVNRRGKFGAETLYSILSGKNKSIRLREELGL